MFWSGPPFAMPAVWLRQSNWIRSRGRSLAAPSNCIGRSGTAASNTLAQELKKRGLDFRREVALSLSYEGIVIPRAYVADVIVERLVVVEIKSIARLGRLEERQLQTYLRMSGCPVGLLLNFGAPVMAEGIKRLANNFPNGTEPLSPEMKK